MNKKEFSIGSVPLSYQNPKLLTHVGVTYDISSPENELKKAIVAENCGADIIADVSLGYRCRDTLKLLTENINIPITSLPGYILATQNGGNELSVNLSKQEILDVTEETLALGIHGFTIHSAFKQKHLALLDKTDRVFPFSSRMGHYLRKYMLSTKKENPFYECFLEIVSLAKKYSATISIGTALRSPSVANPNGGFDDLFKSEIIEMAELVKLCLENDVNVMIEGVGHICVKAIDEWYEFSKKCCYNVPLRALPMVTDRGLGHDNVVGAVAAAFMAQKGVEVICTMTRAEHLGHPTIDDIKESVVSFKIALASVVMDMNAEHLVASARNQGGCHFSKVIENVIDPERAIEEYKKRNKDYASDEEFTSCSMCGESCPVKRPVGE